MEDGVKEDPAQSTEPKFLGKAGWVKKAQGRVLASYKDRYVHVERTEIAVYEKEDLQNCLERLDLENYDKCHELKSPFTKKHRLIVLRSPKSVNKVHDLKFQVPTAEEKEAWIKALTDCINRAKNKVFDEVTVDDSSNLEHVTRTRPKGNRNRRPPTRIHMKEVAGVSSDGILRLDLDLENAVIPNGTHHTTVDGTSSCKEAAATTPLATVSEVEEPSAEEKPKTEPEASPQKKAIKPPMPPTKEAKPSSSPEDEPDKHDGPEKKVPPMPPSKEAKPSTSSAEETTEGEKDENMCEKSPEAKKKAGPPPTPPNKPTSQPTPHPPAPPSKEKKPLSPAVEPGQGTADENEEKDEDNMDDTTGAAKETDQSLSKDAGLRDDKVPETTGNVSEEETEETSSKASNNEPLLPKEPLNKSSTLPNEGQDATAPLQTASDTSAEEAPSKSEVPPVVVSSNDPFSDSPLLDHLPGEKKKKEEEKSVDSGQHSNDDSEGSGSEDTLAASTAALRGSNPRLDVFDNNEDTAQISIDLRPTQATGKQLVKAMAIHCRRSAPIPPLKPSSKARSASIGDLLSDSSTPSQESKHTKPGDTSDSSATDDVIKLQTEVSLEMEKTSELLSRVSQSQGGGDKESAPEDLLAKAMEKLKMADHVLREVKKLKLAKNLNNRKSW